MPRPEDTGRTHSRPLALAVIGYVLLAVAATWPLAAHLTTHTPGSEWWGERKIWFDTPVNLWNLWWFRYALLELRENPFHCRYIFYPYGADLWLHTLSPLHAGIGVGLQAFLPLVAALNVLVLVLLAAAGTATYGLARFLGLPFGGSFLAGAIYAFAPAVFAHLYVGHLELMALWCLPSALLVFLRIVDQRTPRLRDGGALGVVITAAAYSCYYYALYSVELLAVAAVVCRRQTLRAAALRPLALAAAVTLLGIAPRFSTMTTAGAVPASDFAHFSGDLASYVVPSFNSSVLAGVARGLNERLRPHRLDLPQETTMYAGLSVLGLALLGLRYRFRSGHLGREPPDRHGLDACPTRALLVAVVLTFMVLSLGSELRILGSHTGVPLPGALLVRLPVLQQARAPGRHVVLVMLGLGLLGGGGWLLVRRRAIRAVALVLIVAEYAAVPLPLFSSAVSDVYQRLRTAPGQFAVLEVPFGLRDGVVQLGRHDSAQTFAQTVHHRPTVSGYVSRLPDATWQALLATPVISTLLRLPLDMRQALERDRREGPAFFARWGIRAIVIHPSERNGPAQSYLERVFTIGERERFADGTELLWVAPR